MRSRGRTGNRTTVLILPWILDPHIQEILNSFGIDRAEFVNLLTQGWEAVTNPIVGENTWGEGVKGFGTEAIRMFESMGEALNEEGTVDGIVGILSGCWCGTEELVQGFGTH
jgi:hypothetical protein